MHDEAERLERENAQLQVCIASLMTVIVIVNIELSRLRSLECILEKVSNPDSQAWPSLGSERIGLDRQARSTVYFLIASGALGTRSSWHSSSTDPSSSFRILWISETRD